MAETTVNNKVPAGGITTHVSYMLGKLKGFSMSNEIDNGEKRQHTEWEKNLF